MFHRSFSALAAVAMTAGTLAFAVPAQAAPADDSVTISFGGLDLADPAYAARVDRRIRMAARDACGSTQRQPVEMMKRAAACEKAVVAEAQGAVELASARQGGPFRMTLRSH
jgi:UrcA family protein